MKKSPANPTTAKNLEAKFDRGEDVLDYFDVRRARVINPQSTRSAAKTKFTYAVKQSSNRRATAVREKSAAYHKKK